LRVLPVLIIVVIERAQGDFHTKKKGDARWKFKKNPKTYNNNNNNNLIVYLIVFSRLRKQYLIIYIG